MRNHGADNQARCGPAGLKAKTLQGVIWVVSGAMSQTVLKIVLLAVLARLLTPDEFGLIALSIALGSFVMMACRFGVGPALVQLPDLSRAHVAAAITVAIPVAALASAGLFLAAPQVASFFGQPELVPLLYVYALVPFMLGISQVPQSLLQRDLRFGTLTLVDGAGIVLGYAAVSVTLALLGFGAVSVICGLVAQEAVRAVLLFSIRFVRPGLGFGLSELRGLLRFGFGVSLVQATNAAAYQVDNIVVSKILGIQALGLYSRAYQVITAPTNLIGNSLIRVLFPVMSRVQNDRQRFDAGFSGAIGFTAVVALPATAVLFVFAPEIILVMLGGQWSDAVEPFRILSLAILFRIGHKVCEAVIRAKGAVFRLWIVQLSFAVSVLAVAYVGSRWGISGVSFGVLLASALNFALLIDLTRRLTGVAVLPLLKGFLVQFGLALPFSAILWITADRLRAIEVGALPVLIAGCLVALLISGATFFLFPQVFGPHGVFMSGLVGKRLARLRHRAVRHRPDGSPDTPQGERWS